MMWFGFLCCDDLIADLFWEGNIHKRVAVDVTDLAFADAKFRAAEAVWMGFDSLLCEQGVNYLF